MTVTRLPLFSCLPVPLLYPPLPRPFLRTSPTPQFSALNNCQLSPAQAHWCDWPQASFSAAPCNDHQVCHVHLPPCWHITQVSGTSHIDWCCFYYFLRNSLVALLEALFARICVHGDAWYLCILYTQDYASTCIIFLSQSRTPTAGHCAPDIRLVEWRALRDVSAPLCPCRIDNSRSFVTSIVVASLLDQKQSKIFTGSSIYSINVRFEVSVCHQFFLPFLKNWRACE